MAGSFGEEFVFPELGGAEAAEAMHPEVTGTPSKVTHVFGTRSFRTTDARDPQSFHHALPCLQVFDPLRKPPKRTAPKRAAAAAEAATPVSGHERDEGAARTLHSTAMPARYPHPLVGRQNCKRAVP